MEGYQRQFRKVTKNKGVFTSDIALEKLVYLAFTRIRKKWTQPVQNWGADGLATGYPVPEQVQDHSLTTSFVWSSLTILITNGAVLEY